jgi:hypothetical protein
MLYPASITGRVTNRSILTRSQNAGSIPRTPRVRRSFANTGRNSLGADRLLRLPQRAPAATYFELLMSLPAKRTLSQLLHA